VVEALAGQRQVPGWDATVSRELVSYLRVSVTGAWRHGWQPAELVRHAGWEKGDSHARMATDMIAGEMRGYAAATVDDRWLAQLSALRAEVWWWGSDDAYLGRWRDREGDSPQATLITAVELLFVLGHLPAVIGFPADLDAVELLFTSLLVQANTAMLRAGAKRDQYGRSRTRAFRQSFLMSYAIRMESGWPGLRGTRNARWRPRRQAGICCPCSRPGTGPSTMRSMRCSATASHITGPAA
jgi:hypothetical protein